MKPLASYTPPSTFNCEANKRGIPTGGEFADAAARYEVALGRLCYLQMPDFQRAMATAPPGSESARELHAIAEKAEAYLAGVIASVPHAGLD